MASAPQGDIPAATAHATLTSRTGVEVKVEEEAGASLGQTSQGQGVQSPHALAEASAQDIPPPLPVPQKIPVPVEKQVVFHLETTGTGPFSHILQIAAVFSDVTFCKYVCPKKPIEDEAFSNNGFFLDKQILFLNKKPVTSVTIHQALTEFLEFLGNQPVTLFAHNAKQFHSIILLNALRACNMLTAFLNQATGFVDTLPLFKEVWPGLESYKKIDLYARFLNDHSEAHDAMHDVDALQQLLTLSKATTDDFCRNSFSAEYVLENEKYKAAKKDMLESWQPMINSKSVTKFTAEKAAGSGLGVHHLRMAFQRNGKRGVQDALSQTGSSGKPRVTKTEKRLDSISSYIALHPTEQERGDEHEADEDGEAEDDDE